MSKKKKKITISKKQIYAIIAGFAIILLACYCMCWYSVKSKDKLINSYLISTNTLPSEIKNIDEFNQINSEIPNEYFILISHTNDKNTLVLEKKLKKIIDKYKINDVVYYINVTKYKNTDDLYDKLNKTFETSAITEEPCILYFKDRKFNSIIKLDNKKNIDTFEQLLLNNNYEN